jgi:hypothetical protein
MGIASLGSHDVRPLENCSGPRAVCYYRKPRAAYNRRMAARRINEPIEPMTLAVSCWHCHHKAVISAVPWPDDMPVPMFGPRMVCTRCGIVGADARPNWREQPARESLSGVQWR